MSENVSPRVWQLPAGEVVVQWKPDGPYVVSHRWGADDWLNLPTDAVELVPVTRVHGLEAELAEVTAQRDGKIRANSRLTQELAEAKAAITRLSKVVDEKIADNNEAAAYDEQVAAAIEAAGGQLILDTPPRVEFTAKAAPTLPEPDANNPAVCRYIAAVSRGLDDQDGKDFDEQSRGLTAQEWLDRADRIEAERAAEAERNTLTEHLAHLLHHHDDQADFIDVARALLDDPPITITRTEVAG